MSSEDQEIIDQADRWKQQEHELARERLRLKHERRLKIIGIFGNPNLQAGTAILFAVCAFFAFIVALANIHPQESTEIFVCPEDSKILNEQLEMCAKKGAAYQQRCVSQVKRAWCETVPTSDPPEKVEDHD